MPDDIFEPATENTVIIQDEALKQFEGGFTAIPNRILEYADLSLGARMVYAMLLKFAWQRNFCFPAQERLATDLGIGIRSVRTYLNELRDAKLITWKQQGLNRPNVYYILKLPPVSRTPHHRPGPATFAAPDRQDATDQDRQDSTRHERQKRTYQEDSTNKTQHVNVDTNRKGTDARGDTRLTSDTQPITELMGTRYSRLTAEASQRRTAAAADDRTNDEAQEDYYLSEIMQQLGDTDPRSRATYRKILRTLGTSLTMRLVGSTRDAYADGVIQQQKMAPYFIGMVKNVAAQQGIELPFRTRQS